MGLLPVLVLSLSDDEFEFACVTAGAVKKSSDTTCHKNEDNPPVLLLVHFPTVSLSTVRSRKANGHMVAHTASPSLATLRGFPEISTTVSCGRGGGGHKEETAAKSKTWKWT